MCISFPNQAVDKDLCLGEIQSGSGLVQLGTRRFCHQTLLQGRSQEGNSVIATPVLCSFSTSLCSQVLPAWPHSVFTKDPSGCRLVATGQILTAQNGIKLSSSSHLMSLRTNFILLKVPPLQIQAVFSYHSASSPVFLSACNVRIKNRSLLGIYCR